MKKYIILLLLVLASNSSISQTKQDVKEFIIEKFNENYLEVYSPSFIFFSGNILKVDAESFVGNKLSDNEFNHVFICASDIEIGATQSEIISFSESIDIRDITKVSTTKQEDNNYIIYVYLSGYYKSTRSVHNSLSNKTIRKGSIQKMKIQLGTNSEAALQIKKAIIYLGKLYGITIKDGDLF